MIKRRFVLLTSAGILAAGGLTACGSSSSGTGNATAAGTGNGAAVASGGQAPAGAPPAGAPGMGTIVTGTAATKATAAATAKYPGTAEKVVRLADGSYVVHVITSTGEQHVKVSKAFAVTGLDAGGPPAGGPGTTAS